MAAVECQLPVHNPWHRKVSTGWNGQERGGIIVNCTADIIAIPLPESSYMAQVHVDLVGQQGIIPSQAEKYCLPQRTPLGLPSHRMQSMLQWCGCN